MASELGREEGTREGGNESFEMGEMMGFLDVRFSFSLRFEEDWE